jgi:hypothetical protein
MAKIAFDFSKIWNFPSSSFIFQKLENYSLKIPPATTLPYCDVQLPHCFVGEDAFPLKTYLMKHYSG